MPAPSRTSLCPPPQEKVRCKKSGSQGKLTCKVAHKVSQLKQKVKSKGLPAGISPFRRKDPNPAGRIQKKLSRPKSSKAAKYQTQDPDPRQPAGFKGKAGAGLGVRGPVRGWGCRVGDKGPGLEGTSSCRGGGGGWLVPGVPSSPHPARGSSISLGMEGGGAGVTPGCTGSLTAPPFLL